MNRRTNARGSSLICALILSVMAAYTHAAQTELPYTVASRYNAAGQLTGTIGPNPGNGHPATRYTYGTSGATKGLLLTVERGVLDVWSNENTAPASWTGFQVQVTTAYTYDAFGRKATERVIGTNLATESLVQYSYDSWDRVVCKAVRMNPSTYTSPPPDACLPGPQGSFGPDRIFRYTYDKFDQVLTEERADGTPLHQTYVTNTYYGRGVLKSQTDANGNRTELRYDSDWRLERRVYPSPNAPGSLNEADYNAYDYDSNGNVTWERKRNGTSITSTYDANNRLTFKDLSNNTHSADVSYDYDLRGLTLSSRFGSDAGQGITNTFDGFGRLTSATTNVGGTSRTLTYQYDANGNRTHVTHPDGWFFRYGFDALDRLSGLSESNSPSPGATLSTLLTLDYHRGGGRWHIYRPGGATTTYLQDNVKRLDSFSQDFANTANDLTNAFSYNPANQITFLTRSNDLYSISGVVSRTGAYVPNGLNQYTSIAGQSVSYDANGNLTALNLPNDQTMSYTYDMENRLVAANGTINNQSVNASFSWDPLGRLHQVTIDGNSRQFLYDGDALVAEFSGSTMTRRYIHGDQVDEPLVQYDSSTVGASYRRYLHADHQGSIIAQSSNTGGVLFRNAYDPYGIPAAGNDGRFGYTGQAWLKELGLYHYKARMYHPKIGRFLQTDPIFYADDMNMYAYVGGDPVSNVDPTGEFCVPCITAGVGAVVGFGIEAYSQYKTGNFNASRLVISTLKGGAIGALGGLGGMAAAEVYGASAATATLSAAGSTTVASTILNPTIDIMTGEKRPSEVRFADALKQGVLDGAGDLTGGGSGKAVGAVGDLLVPAVRKAFGSAEEAGARAAANVAQVEAQAVTQVGVAVAGQELTKAKCANGQEQC